MKNIYGYWIDENNNRWDEEKYTKLQAMANSKSLVDCTDCTNCRYCTDCTDCRDCRDCTNCTDLQSVQSQPQIYTTGKVGSRYTQTTFVFSEGKIFVRCGCFWGTVAEFELAVNVTHGDNEHGIEYKKEIAKAKILFEIEDK